MKNLLRKIGVIGLAIAILAPFVKLPEVEAANDNCTTHVQTYMFLDVAGIYQQDGIGFSHYDNGGYQTFTVFPYAFPTDAKITIKSVGAYSFNDSNYSSQMDAYAGLYSMANAIQAKGVLSSGKIDAVATGAKTLVSAVPAVAGTTGTFDDYTVLYHGDWSNVGADGNPIKGTWEDANRTDLTTDNTIPYIFSKKNLGNKLETKIGGASYVNGRFSAASPATVDASYFQSIVDDISKAQDDNKLYPDGDGGYLIPLSISRAISDFDTTLANFSVGGGEESKYYSNPSDFINKENEDDGKQVTDADFNTDVWSYYWPVVLNVSYEACQLDNAPDVEDGKWRLEYDANADGDTSVENLPSSQTADVGDGIKVASGPTRKGHTFVEWCLKDGDCYKPGDEITLSEEGVVTLYAKWTKVGGTTDNSKTGIVSYIISFVAVGAIAGGIYFVSKKKNLFKQI